MFIIYLGVYIMQNTVVVGNDCCGEKNEGAGKKGGRENGEICIIDQVKICRAGAGVGHRYVRWGKMHNIHSSIFNLKINNPMRTRYDI